MEKELIRRYFQNRVSLEDEELVSEFLMNPDNEKEVLDFIESSYKEEDGFLPMDSFDIMFEKAKGGDTSPSKIVSLLKTKWLWAASAACVLFLLLGGWIGYSFRSNLINEGVFLLNTAQTSKGQYAHFTLSDGSEVYLGGDSKMSFSKKIDVHPVVYLEGEAYFDLGSGGKSVTVKTKDIVTTAKGSKFNITAFLKDSTVTVTVEKGKAEVRKNSEVFPLLKLRIPGKDSLVDNDAMIKSIPMTKLLPPITVKENEQATYDKNTKVTDIIEVGVRAVLPWMKIQPALKENEQATNEKGAKEGDEVKSKVIPLIKLSPTKKIKENEQDTIYRNIKRNN